MKVQFIKLSGLPGDFKIIIMDKYDSVFNLLSHVLTTVYSAINLNFLCSVDSERFILHSTPKVQLFY